jgi:hypothetical protein
VQLGGARDLVERLARRAQSRRVARASSATVDVACSSGWRSRRIRSSTSRSRGARGRRARPCCVHALVGDLERLGGRRASRGHDDAVRGADREAAPLSDSAPARRRPRAVGAASQSTQNSSPPMR